MQRIVIPLGRSYDMALTCLQEHFNIDITILKDKKPREYILVKGNYEFVFIKPNDVLIFCENQPFDLALIGSDNYEEYDTLNGGYFKVVHKQPWGKQRVSLITKDKAVEDITTIYTPYVGLMRKTFPDKKVIKANSSLEIYPCLNDTNAIVDVVETGETMRLHGLSEVQRFFDLEMYVFTKEKDDLVLR